MIEGPSGEHADVAEPVDATDLKSVEGNLVGVRVPPSAPIFEKNRMTQQSDDVTIN